MRRREFLGVLGCAASWPVSARAQGRARRIGVLQIQASGDSVRQMYLQEFRYELARLGWTEGRNVHLEVRFGAGDAAVTRKHVEELIAFAPDVILTSGAAGVAPLLQATRTVHKTFDEKTAVARQRLIEQLQELSRASRSTGNGEMP